MFRGLAISRVSSWAGLIALGDFALQTFAAAHLQAAKGRTRLGRKYISVV